MGAGVAMPGERLRMFGLDCRLGTVWGAVSEGGLLALSLPRRTREEFLARVERLAPGAEALWVAAEDTTAGRRLRAYLAGQSRDLTMPLDLRGRSPFAARVLEAVRAIPYGRTRTYGEIAAQAGNPQAARAVGRAVGANPIPVFIA